MTTIDMPIDKAAVLAALLAEVSEALAVMTQAARTAHAAATHEEMKPENDKDTRGIEAGYLAAGQSARAAELQRTLHALQSLGAPAFPEGAAVAVAALVSLRDLSSATGTDADGVSHVFLSPHGGGMKVTVAGARVQVVTPLSPLGDALMGKHVGDVVELRAGPRLRELEIVAVG